MWYFAVLRKQCLQFVVGNRLWQTRHVKLRAFHFKLHGAIKTTRRRKQCDRNKVENLARGAAALWDPNGNSTQNTQIQHDRFKRTRSLISVSYYHGFSEAITCLSCSIPYYIRHVFSLSFSWCQVTQVDLIDLQLENKKKKRTRISTSIPKTT